MRNKRFDSRAKQRHKVTREEDAAYRLTHLWAASHLVAGHSQTLSRFYVATSRQICQRINLKADSVTIKRAICKRCNTLLVPGLGDRPPRIRHVPRREKHLVVTCGNCQGIRRFLTRKPSDNATSISKRRRSETKQLAEDKNPACGEQNEQKRASQLQLRSDQQEGGHRDGAQNGASAGKRCIVQ